MDSRTKDIHEASELKYPGEHSHGKWRLVEHQVRPVGSGLDALVFAGGIGENAPRVRARICDGLGCLGIEINDKRNAETEGVISTDGSRFAVRVMRTDGNLMIARSVSRVFETDATLLPPGDHTTSSDHRRSSSRADEAGAS